MKKFFSILLILISIILLSGCVKNTNSMTIDKDKNMTYEVEVLVSTLISDEVSANIDTSKYESNGFKVTNVNFSKSGDTPEYSGIKLKKTYKNIDDYSSDAVDRVNLKELLENEDIVNLFVHKKSFLKDIYTAKFSIMLSDEDNILKKEEVTNNEETEDESETETSENLDESSMEDLNKISELTNDIELKYVVNLPYSCTSSNADEKSNLNRTLTWNLSYDGTTHNIDYTFNIYNIKNMIIVSSLVLIVIVGCIIGFIVVKKKLSSRNTLIFKEGELEEDNNNQSLTPESNNNINQN